MALAIAWQDFGDGRASSGAASIIDTMVLPAVSNAVLFLHVGKIHKASASLVSVSLTGETVDEISAFTNTAGDSVSVDLGSFAVRNPGGGAKTITVADDALARSMFWHAWLVTGVPASGYADATHHPSPASSSQASLAASLSTTKPNGLILASFGWRGNDKGPFGLSAGWIEDADQSPGASATIDAAHHMAHRTAPTIGAYSATSTPTVAARGGQIATAVLPSLIRRRQVIVT